MMNGRLSADELGRRLDALKQIDRTKELARLLAASGWSPMELAEHRGQSQTTWSELILYGRFLGSASQTAISKSHFITLWKQTNEDDNEDRRFAVVRQAAQSRRAKPSKALANKIMARIADGKWHALDAVAEQLSAARAALDVALDLLPWPPHLAKVEYKTVGIRPHCRIFHADKMIPLSELKEKFGPIIAELKQQGKTNAATVSIGAVNHCAHRLQQIIDEWSA